MLNKDRFLNSIVIALFVIGIACILYVVIKSWKISHDQNNEGNMACVKETSIYEVKDEHLKGLFNEGDKLKIYPNFYQCNQVQRGDYVHFSIAEGLPPVVRIVHGLPGDRYDIAEDKSTKGRWSIAINGEAVQANGAAYFLQSNTIPPLRTYQLSRNGVLADNEYIILSATPPGLSDSSNLGLIQRERFVGKAVMAEVK
jgi:hypothetical protein